jgi:hypothetical protein
MVVGTWRASESPLRPTAMKCKRYAAAADAQIAAFANDSEQWVCDEYAEVLRRARCADRAGLAQFAC